MLRSLVGSEMCIRDRCGCLKELRLKPMDIYSVTENKTRQSTLDSELTCLTTVSNEFFYFEMKVKRRVTRPKKKEPLAIKHKEYLSLFSKAAKKPSRRNKLVDVADSGEIRAVSECIQNILEGNVPVDHKVLQQMKKYKSLLRSLAQKCYPIKQKKRILKQKGGFIGALVPLAISAATSLLPSLINAFTK